MTASEKLEAAIQKLADRVAGSAERGSEHPLGAAIYRAARERRTSLTEPDRFEALPGKGVKVVIRGSKIYVGTRPLMKELGIAGTTAAEMALHLTPIRYLNHCNRTRGLDNPYVAWLAHAGWKKEHLQVPETVRTYPTMGFNLCSPLTHSPDASISFCLEHPPKDCICNNLCVFTVRCSYHLSTMLLDKADKVIVHYLVITDINIAKYSHLRLFLS